MAWQDSMILMVRYLIGDTAEPYKFSDSKIEQSIVIGGLLAAQDFPFTTQYTFDVGNATIGPDPSSDYQAVALFTLRAAAMLVLDGYQKAVTSGIRVKDGDSEVDTTSSFKGWADIVSNGPQKSYDTLKKDLMLRRNIGRAVMTPASIGINSPWGRSSVQGFFDSLSWR